MEEMDTNNDSLTMWGLICIKLIVYSFSPQFFCILRFNQPLPHSTAAFTTEKHPSISRLLKFKPMLFKGQLYCITNVKLTKKLDLNYSHNSNKKKWQLYNVTEMPSNSKIEIILQCINISNQHGIHLNHNVICQIHFNKIICKVSLT